MNTEQKQRLRGRRLDLGSIDLDLFLCVAMTVSSSSDPWSVASGASGARFALRRDVRESGARVGRGGGRGRGAAAAAAEERTTAAAYKLMHSLFMRRLAEGVNQVRKIYSLLTRRLRYAVLSLRLSTMIFGTNDALFIECELWPGRTFHDAVLLLPLQWESDLVSKGKRPRATLRPDVVLDRAELLWMEMNRAKRDRRRKRREQQIQEQEQEQEQDEQEEEEEEPEEEVEEQEVKRGRKRRRKQPTASNDDGD